MSTSPEPGSIEYYQQQGVDVIMPRPATAQEIVESEKQRQEMGLPPSVSQDVLEQAQREVAASGITPATAQNIPVEGGRGLALAETTPELASQMTPTSPQKPTDIDESLLQPFINDETVDLRAVVATGDTQLIKVAEALYGQVVADIKRQQDALSLLEPYKTADGSYDIASVMATAVNKPELKRAALELFGVETIDYYEEATKPPMDIEDWRKLTPEQQAFVRPVYGVSLAKWNSLLTDMQSDNPDARINAMKTILHVKEIDPVKVGPTVYYEGLGPGSLKYARLDMGKATTAERMAYAPQLALQDIGIKMQDVKSRVTTGQVGKMPVVGGMASRVLGAGSAVGAGLLSLPLIAYDVALAPTQKIIAGKKSPMTTSYFKLGHYVKGMGEFASTAARGAFHGDPWAQGEILAIAIPSAKALLQQGTIKISSVKSPVDNSVVWTGLDIKGNPIVGVSKLKPTVGKKGIKMPEGTAEAAYKPISEADTTILTDAKALRKMGFKEPEIAQLQETLKAMQDIYGKPSPKKVDFIEPEAIKSLSREGVGVVLKAIAADKRVDYGYGSLAIKKLLLGEDLGRMPHDIDIQLKVGGERASNFIADLAEGLRRTEGSGNVRISGNLIETRTEGGWRHAVDIHPVEPAKTGAYTDPAAGYGYVGNKLSQPLVTIKYPGFGKVKIMSLSESGIRKGIAVSRWFTRENWLALAERQGIPDAMARLEKLGLADKEKLFLPEPKRLKDISDFYMILKTFRGEDIATRWAEYYNLDAKGLAELAKESPPELMWVIDKSPSASAGITSGVPIVSIATPRNVSLGSTGLAGDITSPTPILSDSPSPSAVVSLGGTTKAVSPGIKVSPTETVSADVIALSSLTAQGIPSDTPYTTVGYGGQLPFTPPSPAISPPSPPSIPPTPPSPAISPPSSPSIPREGDTITVTTTSIAVPRGSVAWAQGMYWKYIPPPYVLKKPITLPRGVYPGGAVNTTSGVPTETIQVIGETGAVVPDISIDLGVSDVYIWDNASKIEFKGKGGRTNVGTRIDSTTEGLSIPPVESPFGYLEENTDWLTSRNHRPRARKRRKLNKQKSSITEVGGII